MSFTVRVLTPEKIELETTCDEVILPAVNGNLSILTGHARLVSVLKTGVFRQKTEKGWAPIILLGGFAEIHNDLLIVLALGTEQLSPDLTLEDVKKAVDEASNSLTAAKDKSTDLKIDPDVIEAASALSLAEARLEAFKYIN
jgi:F-type H+-transporting ATPase subunit epsilon